MFNRRLTVLLAVVLLILGLTACGSKDNTDYETLRDLSWEGTELTIKLGQNKGTGCNWDTHPMDDSVIDYSINRSFKLADSQVKKGNAIGTLSAGFKGKGPGTTQIVCTTPVGWDGSGDGMCYIVTVTVKEDGTIDSAEGKEADAPPATEAVQKEETSQTGEEEEAGQAVEAEASGESEDTLEDYFNEHPEVLKELREKLKEEVAKNSEFHIDLEVKGNTLSYLYTLEETYSEDQLAIIKPALEKNLEKTAKDSGETISTMEEGFGVKGIKLYMEIRNGDGSKICSRTMG